MANLTDRRPSVDVTANKTLVAADSGIVQNVVVDGVTITMPATANGLSFIIRNGGVKAVGGAAGTVSDGSLLAKLAPAAADGITGLGFTAAVNKAAQNTKSTSKVGDELQVDGTGTTGVTAWIVSRAVGTWVRET